MMFGGVFGGTPTGAFPINSQASPPPFSLLPADAALIHWVRVQPRNPDTASIETHDFLDREWFTHEVAGKVRLTQPFSYRVSITSGGSGIGGAATPVIGSIRLAAQSEWWDSGERKPLDTEELRDLQWDGRMLEIKAGVQGFAMDEFGEIFSGQCWEILSDDTGHEIRIAPLGAKLEVPIQTNEYAGTGGLEGDSDLEKRPKPLAWGICRNITPVNIDRFNNVYQWNDGPSSAVLNVWDRGVPFDFLSDSTNIYGTTPAPGEYTTDLSRSLIRLGAPPVGEPTMDVQADSSGAGYIDTVGAIALRIAEDKASMDTTTEIEVSSFSGLDVSWPYSVGFYLSRPTQTCAQVIDTLVAGRNVTGVLLGFRTFTRQGKLRVGRVKFGTSTRTLRTPDILRRRRASTQIPFYKLTVGYKQAHTVQGSDQLSQLAEASGGPLDSHRAFVQERFRLKQDTSAAIQTAHPFAQALEKNTLLDTLADAESAATEIFNLLSPDRNFYQLDVRNHRYKIGPGDTVTIDDSLGWGISGQYIVLEIGEDARRGTTQLGVWG